MRFDEPPLCCIVRMWPTLPDELTAHPGLLAQGITTVQAADFLGIAASSLETMRVRGGGPSYEKISNRVRYRRLDLLRFKLNATRRSTSSAGHDEGLNCDCGRGGRP